MAGALLICSFCKMSWILVSLATNLVHNFCLVRLEDVDDWGIDEEMCLSFGWKMLAKYLLKSSAFVESSVAVMSSRCIFFGNCPEPLILWMYFCKSLKRLPEKIFSSYLAWSSMRNCRRSFSIFLNFIRSLTLLLFVEFILFFNVLSFFNWCEVLEVTQGGSDARWLVTRGISFLSSSHNHVYHCLSSLFTLL